MDQVTVLEVSTNVVEVAVIGPQGPTGPQGIQGPPGSNAWADITGKPTTLTGYGITDAEHSANKGMANGYAGLDSGGKVPAAQLPSYVDDVLEYANLAAFPGTGSTGIIYVADDTGKIYRWSGSSYVEISPSPSSTDSVTEGSTNLYFTAARVLATVLTGLSTATNAVISTTDNILSALGKLQKQITDLTTTVAGKLDKAGGTMTGPLNMGSQAISALASLNGGPLGGMRDVLINGDGAINTRINAVAYGGDDVYWCDRHYALVQTASITPTVITDVADGLPYMMRLTQSQASAQRMGNAQIVEAYAAKRVRGKPVTLGGFVRCSASQTIRYAILEWTGTADTVTSDVVNNWASGTFTAGNFFLASGLTVAAVGSITPTANTITPWSLQATISSSCNNLIVFMWTDQTAAQNVMLDMVWGLVRGDASSETWPYAPRHIEQDLALCERYCRKAGAGAVGQAFSTTQITLAYYTGTMRGTPNPSVIPSSGSSGMIRIGGGSETAATITPTSVTPNAGYINMGGTGFTSGSIYFGVKDFLILDVEL
ncbi:hypothetical protein [Rhizobium leucaenae]|uniref:hypothetical protein n=1 Tax=Rhizobium leucaenae TaxID=29450 RepID=UPI0007EE8527|nr:hypothetical protein [Rhizobium leucaenae]MBB6299888.1 hypothetical protein [Rhizobium leucaenae]